MKNKSYQKSALMMAVSFIIMYGVMFLNADIFDHVMLSITRTYMTLLMISAMAVTMMLFMWGMYENKKTNYIIIASALVIFVSTLTMFRNQILIADVQWMKAMIPHHSSAIMVSQKAHLKDPEAQQLAQDIIEAQKKEIAQMKAMLERIEIQD